MRKILFGILLSMSIVSISYQTFTSQPKQWLKFVDIAMDSNENLYALGENLRVYKKENWKEIDLQSIPVGITLKKDEYFLSCSGKNVYLLSYRYSECSPIHYADPERDFPKMCAQVVVGWVLYRLENNQWVEKMRLGEGFKVRNFVVWSDDRVVILKDDGALVYRVIR